MRTILEKILISIFLLGHLWGLIAILTGGPLLDTIMRPFNLQKPAGEYSMSLNRQIATTETVTTTATVSFTETVTVAAVKTATGERYITGGSVKTKDKQAQKQKPNLKK